MNELTIEQQFEIAKLKQTIENASVGQLRELFVEFYTVMLRKDNLTKELLAQQWGMDVETVNPPPKVERWIDCGDC
jgi:hypothetical protein